MDKKQMKLIGLIASLIATITIWTGFAIEGIIGDILAVIWMIGLVVGYVLAGGFKRAMGVAIKLCKFGWLLLPFPFDIFTGLVTLVFSFFVFIFCPVIFVFLNFVKAEGEA